MTFQSPIRYFGGKGTMVQRLQAFFPPAFDLYIEPFCGSAVMALNVRDCPMILNDLDLNIYTFFQVLATPDLFAAFKAQVDLLPYHEKVRAEMKAKLHRGNLEAVERAVAFFMVNRMSHNGVGGVIHQHD